MTEIAPLPDQTRSFLRSTVILSSLVQVVSELIQNSLDANARNLDISIDCDEWSCCVQDNGDGISKDNLDIIANSSRHSTSKTYTHSGTFGFRGEALASIADLSILEISSRTSHSRQSWSLILKGNKNLYSGPSIRWKRESHGTTVCVRDAFHNLPIRRRSHPSASRTLEQIRREIETYALVFPEVSFMLKHSQTQQRLMAVPKTLSVVDTFRQVFGRALVQNVQEISKSEGELKLSGFISLHGAPSKNYQFLYINRHPLSPCDFHHIIENKFASSTFAKYKARDESGGRQGTRSRDKKPVYVLNLIIPQRNVDNLMDPAKNVVQIQNNGSVCAFLSTVVHQFLIDNRFINMPPSASHHRNIESDHRPTKRRKISPAAVSPRQPSVSKGNTSDGQEFVISQDTDDPEELIWNDPTTGEIFIVNCKTGNSYPVHSNERRSTGTDSGTGDPIPTRRTLSFPKEQQTEPDAVPEWIHMALKKNDVYSLTEPKIPVLPLSSIFRSDMQRYESQRIKSKNICSHHSTYGVRESTSLFSRENLADAVVLGQVDQKFIACLMPNAEGSGTELQSLVLVDQHAAHERIRVEMFLKEMFLGFLNHETPEGGVKVKILDPAAPILLTRYEARTLKRSSQAREAFLKWGVQFEQLDNVPEIMDEGIENGDYVQVFVKSIPDVVSNKLLQGEELGELVKGYLSELDQDVPAPSQTQHTQVSDEFSWLKVVRKCPSHLLELIDSKACRGAIMFNDPLTMEQCEKLVRSLSETAFPFRCAHGRPSLVPLFNLRTSPLRRVSRSIDWENFERSFPEVH